jgi:hypothetical protein
MIPDTATMLNKVTMPEVLLVTGPGPKPLADAFSRLVGPVNTEITADEMERRTEYALSLGLPSLSMLKDVCRGTAVICGGGHSLDIEEVRARKAAGCKVVVLNTRHDQFIAAGIIPDFSIMLDAAERVATYQTPHPGVVYLIGSSVHPKVWQHFREAGATPFLFVPIMREGQHETMADKFDGFDLCFIPGATTVGLRAHNITGHIGFADDELHGFDSCYAPGNDGITGLTLYGVPKPVVTHDAVEFTIVSQVERHRFTCRSNGAMARQVKGFYSVVAGLPHEDVNGRVGNRRIRVAGDGAIPWMAWKNGGPDQYIEHTHPDRMLAKYGDAEHWDYFRGKPYV